MIPHIMKGVVYSINVTLNVQGSSSVELRDFSTYDALTDTHTWIETDDYRYCVIAGERKGHVVTLTLYLNIDNEESPRFLARRVQDIVRARIVRGLRGVRVLRCGSPHLFLRLQSIEDRIASEEEIRTERIFTELIDS